VGALVSEPGIVRVGDSLQRAQPSAMTHG
jgi:hypothetical protein